MDPITLAIGGSLGLSALAGIGNFFANKSANDRAAMLQDRAFQEIMKIAIPNPEELQLALDRFVSQGELDPRMEQAIQAQPSAMEKIVTDFSNKSAQNRALSELENLAYQGGMTLKDKANLNDQMIQNQAKERGDRLAINSDMARRGLGGSGFDVAAQLQAQQSGADRDSNARLKTLSDARDRAFKAIMGAGDLATNYRNQDFNEQAQKASAIDRINMFNTRNLQDVQQRNVGMKNRASELNLTNKQNIHNKNIAQNNYQQQYNQNLKQQKFDNEMKKAATMTGQANNQANTELRGGQMAGNFFSNVGAAGSDAASAYANKDFWDKYFKSKGVG